MSSSPPSSTPRLLVIVLVGGALILAVIAFRQKQQGGGVGKRHPSVGKAYLPHQFPPLTAEKPVREADLKGKVVLINFWGYWCPPCRTEFPHLVDLEKSLHDTPDFRFISVACSGDPSSDEDDPELRYRTSAFLTEQQADLPTYIDPRATEQLRIGVITGSESVYPTTVIIGRDGTIRGLWPGYVAGYELQMRAVIDEALK